MAEKPRTLQRNEYRRGNFIVTRSDRKGAFEGLEEGGGARAVEQIASAEEAVDVWREALSSLATGRQPVAAT